MRSRSRDMAKNSPLYARFIRLMRENVVGDMPPFAGVVSDDELWKLIAYVRSKYAGDPSLKNW